MGKKWKFVYALYIMVCLAVTAVSPATAMDASDGPETIELDALAYHYEPVSFDHYSHVEMVENDCAACHHHTLGTGISEDSRCAKCHAESGATDAITCQECHPANRFEAEYLSEIEADNTLYHMDKVGLKAAYHLRCMECHKEMGGPTSCQDCHARNEAGDKFFHAGEYAPKEDHTARSGHH